MIAWDNYEEYMMMHADGELTLAEEQELMAFIDMHPQLKSELSAFERTHLMPDTQEVYADKDALLKPVPVKRIIFLPTLRKYGVAAGIAAIAIFSFLKLKDTDNQKTAGYVAKQTIAQPQKSQQANTNILAESTAPATKNNTTRISAKDNVTAVVKHKSQQWNTVKKYAVAAHKKIEITSPQSINARGEEIEKLAVGNKQAMPLIPMALPVPATLNVPEYTQVNEDGGKHFWDKLPIDDVNKKELSGLNNVANAVANAYDKVNAAKQNLNNKSFSVRIEKRKLIVSF